MLSIREISKIGIGTRGVGGLADKDTTLDTTKQIDAMAYMFAQGCNFCEANMRYAQGYSAELLSKALHASGVRREQVFLCAAIYLKGKTHINDAKTELLKLMDLFQTDYIDTLQFNMGSFLSAGFDTIVSWIDELLAEGKIRYTSLTNGNLDFLHEYYTHYHQNLFSHEVVFNFEVRVNESLGIIPYHLQNNIKTVVYQPLRRNRTALRKRDILETLSAKYGCGVNQILLNRIVMHKGYLPLTKSESIEHIKEHLYAIEFTMEAEDYLSLDTYHIPYSEPIIDRYKKGVGYGVDQLGNIFDEIYEAQIALGHS